MAITPLMPSANWETYFSVPSPKNTPAHEMTIARISVTRIFIVLCFRKAYQVRPSFMMLSLTAFSLTQLVRVQTMLRADV